VWRQCQRATDFERPAREPERESHLTAGRGAGVTATRGVFEDSVRGSGLSLWVDVLWRHSGQNPGVLFARLMLWESAAHMGPH
jgi:hypothetical protein